MVTAALCLTLLFVPQSTMQTAPPSVQSGPVRDTAGKDKKGTASIKGKVVTAEGSRPLRRVQVTLSAPEIGEARTVSTSTLGVFEAKDLPAGRYSITASRAGFLRQSYGQRRPGEPGRPIQVADGQALTGIDFALPRMSVISGRVTDEVGEPLAGATVFPMQMRYFRGKRRLVPVGTQVRTDDTGAYRLTGLDPGDYYVMATTRDTWTVDGNEKERVGFGPTYYSGTLSMSDAQKVKAAIGQEVSAIDFSMVPGRVASISGTATTSSGMPLAGESVDIAQEFVGPTSSSMFGFSGSKIAADGSFTIKNIAPGDYKLSVRAPGDKDRPAEGATMVISVTGADIDNVMLVTAGGGSIAGRVVTDEGTVPAMTGSGSAPGLGESRLRVSLRAENPDSTYSRFSQDNGRVKDDGTFEVTEVIGAHRISVNPLGPGWAVKAIEYDGKDYADVPIDVRAGQRLENVTIVVSNKFAAVRGTLQEEDGKPSAGMVILFPEDPAKWAEGSRLVKTARPDSAGTFELRIVPAGDYLIAAVDYAAPGAWDDPEFLQALRDKATKVTVRDGESPAGLSLTLRKER